MRLVDLIEYERTLKVYGSQEAVKGQPKAERGHELASPTAALEGHEIGMSEGKTVLSGSDSVRPMAASLEQQESTSLDHTDGLASA